VEEHIQIFHDLRLQKLQKLSLLEILKRKNPYLFRAKNLTIASDLVKSLLDAYLSSQEEGLFGIFLEKLAIFICGRMYGGVKSTRVGLDLEFQRDGVYYIVSIKSGPFWGNSDQINRMRQNFLNAAQELSDQFSNITVVAVNGCCYGREPVATKAGYLKLCGQPFWALIGGDDDVYVDIIEPIGYKAREKNEMFMQHYSAIINQFTLEFSQQFCAPNGAIDWARLVALSSGR
jgi:hypothetical protein